MDNQQRPYWNMKVEPLLNTPEMDKIRLVKIKKLVTKLYDGKPFWRRWLDEAGVGPGDIRSSTISVVGCRSSTRNSVASCTRPAMVK